MAEAVNNFNRFVHADLFTSDWLINVSGGAADAISFGDLMYDAGSDVARPADKISDQGSLAANQLYFANRFIGVSQAQVLDTESNSLKRIPIRTEGVMEFTCTSATFSKGDMVAIDENDAGNALLSYRVIATTDSSNAIGVVVKNYSSATTTVRVYIAARKCGQQLAMALLRGNANQGSMTVNDITGGDSSLGVTGKTGSSGAGGAIALTGGVGDSGAGGAISMVGGAGNGAYAGGALTLTGGAGGAAGAGGAVTIAGGAPASGNAAGGAGSFTGGAGSGTGAGGAVSLVGGASGTGATGNGGAAAQTGGAALSTNGTGGACTVTGGVATGTGTGGAVTITGGDSGGASGTGGSVNIASGAASGGTVGSVNVQTVSAGKLGFYGTTAIIKYNTQGDQTTGAAGSTTAVYLNTTFTGNNGSTAYKIGDIVAALKAYGLLTA